MVCYDVPKGAERVRTKIALTCQNYGLMRIQYSFFWGTLTEAQVRELAVRCQQIAGDHPLDIRFIAVCSECFRKSYAYIKDLLTQTQDVVPLNSNAFMNVVTHTTFGWDMADPRAEKGAIYRPAESPPPSPPISANLDSNPTSSVNSSPSGIEPQSAPTEAPLTEALLTESAASIAQPASNLTNNLAITANSSNTRKSFKRKRTKNNADSEQSASIPPAPVENSPPHSDLSSIPEEDEEKLAEITLSFDLPDDLSKLTDAQIQELTGIGYNSSGHPLNPSPSNIQKEQQPPMLEHKIEDARLTDDNTDNQIPQSVICRFEEWDQQGNNPGLPNFQQDLDLSEQRGQELLETISSSAPETKSKKKKLDKFQARIHRGAIDIDILFV